jgi:putative transposase
MRPGEFLTLYSSNDSRYTSVIAFGQIFDANGVAMPPKSRTYLPGIPAYIVLRNCGSDCFRAEEDCQFYLDVLWQACQRFDVQLHAYCLLPDCVHLLLTQEQEHQGIDDALHYLDARYAAHLTASGYTESLWEGGHQISLIDADAYLLSCYLHIEFAPVEVGLADRPEDYRWSSFTNHAFGARNSRILDHYLYHALGSTPEQRRKVYAELAGKPIPEQDLHRIRESLVFGQPLGSPRFREQIRKAQEKRLGHRYPGGRGVRDAFDPGFGRN